VDGWSRNKNCGAVLNNTYFNENGDACPETWLVERQDPILLAVLVAANEMNWCHAGRYLFARSRHGSTTLNSITKFDGPPH
jgi:hypothetical protein